MRKFSTKSILSALVAGIGFTAAAASVHAFTIPLGFGPISIKLINEDVGTLYNTAAIPGLAVDPLHPELGLQGTVTGAANLNALPQVGPPHGAPGEDSWGILVVTEIDKKGTNTKLYDSTTSPYQITAIFYGEQDTFLKVTNQGTALEAQEIHGTGLNVDFYASTTKDYNNGTPGTVARGSAGPGGAPSYPTVTQGTLIWSTHSTPGVPTTTPDPSAEFSTLFQPAATGPFDAFTKGSSWLNFGADKFGNVGADNGQFMTNPAGSNPPRDVDLQFSGTASSTADWLVDSNDPATAFVVPEPATLTVLGLGTIGLIGARRIKARA